MAKIATLDRVVEEARCSGYEYRPSKHLSLSLCVAFLVAAGCLCVQGTAWADVRPPEYGDSQEALVQSLLQGNRWLYLSLFALTLTTALAVGISFYLYRWRKIVLTDGRVLLPEELAAAIRALDDRFDKLANEIWSFTGAMQTMGASTREDAKNLLQTFMTLQSALDDRDQEIQRLKRGYDAELYRRFLNRFIQVDQAAEDIANAGDVDLQGLEDIRALLADAFAECGVERFEPETMSDFRSAKGVAENPKKQPTDDPDLYYKISEVVESGYKIRGQEGETVLIPAKIRVFVPAGSVEEV